MTSAERIRALWADMDTGNWSTLPSYFTSGAVIIWPNTGERFTPEEFRSVNAAYPGRWNITVERLEAGASSVVSVAEIRAKDGFKSFYVVSFFDFDGDSIATLTEYWSEDGAPPAWRNSMLKQV